MGSDRARQLGGFASQHADDEGGDRLRGHDQEGFVTFERLTQGLGDSFEGLFALFALGSANRLGMVFPLLEDARLLAADIVRQQSLPQTQMQVGQPVDDLDRNPSDSPSWVAVVAAGSVGEA